MLRTATRVTFTLSLLAGFAAADRPAAAQEVQQTIRIGGAVSDGGPISILPPGRQPKVGTGRLLGRVRAGDTGSALRRAQVRITSPDIGTKTALTDMQGRFEFRDLPAGRFTVSVSKSGFVTMQFGQNRPFEPGRPIELTDGQLMDKADVSLPRGSVLAGRITDEFGESVAEAEVVAMRLQYQNGRRRLVPSGRNASTNDLGQYRIYGLPPGEYYVSATLRNAGAMVLDMIAASGASAGAASQPQQSGYASTYYPSSPNPSEAQRVAVAVAQELATVDIQLQPVKLARVSGVALGSDGKPMGGAMVMLMPSMRDAMMLMPGGTSRTDKDGNFTLNGVAPGEYSLQVQSMGGVFQTTSGGNVMAFAFATTSDGGPGGGEQRVQQQREFAVASLNVAGEDLTGLVLTGTRGAKASGAVTFLGGVKPEGAGQIRLLTPATEADANPMPSFGGGQVKENGTFEVDSLIGGRIFRVANLPRGWVLNRVTRDGQDVTDRGIEFKPGEDVGGIEIELTNRTTAITGTVFSPAGPAKDFTVVVFAQDEDKWVLPQNRWMSSARPDQDGQFRVNNLPAGNYYAVAVEYVAQGEWQDPEWLQRASKTATKLSLDEGAQKTIELKLSSGS